MVDSLNKGYPWPGIDWVIAGGESGPDARPTHPDWLRSLRDQCTAAAVPFFFKQWGEWFPLASADEASQGRYRYAEMHEDEDGIRLVKIGKKAAGRILDGRIWDEMPIPQDRAETPAGRSACI